MANKNSNLHGAKVAKNDEFYTRAEDIEAEVRHYHDPVIPGVPPSPKARNPFRGKTVYLNCDDPQWSNFWKFFARKFDELQLGRLISTHYEADGSPSYAMFLERDAEGNMIDNGVDESGAPLGSRQDLQGNGDFRSEECIELLKQSDVVVTNMPFSLSREYVAQLMQYGKKFLVIANKNCITYKEFFPLIKDNKMWVGATPMSQDMLFRVPLEYAEQLVTSGHPGSKYRIFDGEVMARAAAIWLTNLDHKKRHEELDLFRRYQGHEAEYPTYDNYDAIEISKVKDIPEDYDGVMGVPITFLDKYNPDQFELVGCSDNGLVPDEVKLPHFKRHNEPFVNGVKTYKRMMIRRVI